MYFPVILLFIGVALCAPEKYKLCAPESISDTTCNALTRGEESEVSCLRVTDSAECAIQLAEGKADFGLFNAEEMLLAYQFYPDDLKPITQLRHVDRTHEEFEFQTVAVVPSEFDGRNGLQGLENLGLCHPGFSESQILNDRILKHFEKAACKNPCRSWHIPAVENEIENLKDFFGSSCRPGEWVADAEEDKRLKSKHPQLCELCDDKANCKYRNTTHHGHFGALECLDSGRGGVAYVAYEYVRQYFRLNTGIILSRMSMPPRFQFLCPDGTTRPLTSNDPCAWIRQPWNAIVARKEKAVYVLNKLKVWLPNVAAGKSPQEWTVALRTIFLSNAVENHYTVPLSLRQYLTTGRQVDWPSTNPCAKEIRWCTVNQQETVKCNWIAKEAVVGLGIEPSIVCTMANSTFDCLRNIAAGQADIVTIDSNYGYIARQVFNLTTRMYAESNNDRNSQVLAIVREDAPNKVSSFSDLKKKTACFPEYGGIAWLSFLHTIRQAKIVSDSCDHTRIVSEFLSGACAPGISDTNHFIASDPPSHEATRVLCSICPIEQNNATCSASHENFFYSDKGALECVKSGIGDIAFIEPKNLQGRIKGKLINPDDYRVLCRNGSLATYTGFDVDEQCALSATIDSEVVGRNRSLNLGTSEVLTQDVTLALLKLEDWLGYRVGVLRPIRIYDSFQGQSNLLFKDSTVGLVPTSSEIKSVMAYKELMSGVQACSGSSPVDIFPISCLIALAICLINNLHS